MNFKNKKTFFLPFLFILSVTAFSQGEKKLTLSIEDSVKYATEGNLSAKEAEISLGSAKRASSYSWNSFIPTIKASGTLSGTTDTDDPAISIGASASLGLSPSIYTSIKAAKLSYQQEQITYEQAVRTIELNVRKAYNKLLYESEYLKLLEANVSSAKLQYDTNQTRYNRGQLAKLDVVSAQVSYQNAKVNYENQEVTFANDLDSFKQMLGINLDTEITLSGSLEGFLSLDSITENSIKDLDKKSADIETLEKKIEVGENSLLATRFSAWGPSLTGSISYQKSGTVNTGIDSDSGVTSYSVGLSIPLDGYIPWSSGALSIENQKDNLKSLQLQLEDAKTTYRMNVANYLKKIQSSQSALKLRQSSVELAKESYQMSLEAYNRGTKDLLSLQSALDSLTEAQVNVMSEAYTLASNILDLENTIGVPFGTIAR